MSRKADGNSHKKEKEIGLTYIPVSISEEEQNEKVDRAFDVLFGCILKANKNENEHSG